jgi:hypothetical protein
MSDVRPLFLPLLVPIVAALRERPRPGVVSEIEVFDPDRGAATPMRVTVAAESMFVVVDSAVSVGGNARWLAVHRDTVRAWRLDAPGTALPRDLWVDELGQVVSMRRGDGLVLRRTAFELAFENWRLASPARGIAARADGDVVSGTLLASGVTLPQVVLDSLRVRVRAAPPRSMTSRFGSQFRQNFAWTAIRLSEAALVPRYRFPTSNPWRRAFQPNLRPEPRIEADDPGIRRLAGTLRRDDTDPSRIAARLVRWVHDSVARDAAAQPASAAELLQRRRGDANEFARLLVALGRAAGIPSRSVSGLLFADGRFYYHAWAQLYVGRWVDADPMLGQWPADAAHLSVLFDALDAQPELMRVLGRLDLIVVAAYPREEQR